MRQTFLTLGVVRSALLFAQRHSGGAIVLRDTGSLKALQFEGQQITKLLKDYAPIWPPDTTTSDGKIPPQARLDDVVLAVKVGAFAGQLGLVMCRQYGIEYTVPVVVPEPLQQKLIFDIVRRKKITLREVGDLRIS